MCDSHTKEVDHRGSSVVESVVLEFVWLVEPIVGSGLRLKARVGGVRVDLAECPDHVHQFIRYFVVSCVTCKIECSTSYCLHTTFLE